MDEDTDIPDLPENVDLPPVDEAAQAQAGREAVAARTARQFTRPRKRAAGDMAPVRPVPRGAAQLAPVPVQSDEEYQALAAGTMFTGPDGVTRRKPYYVSDDASYDQVPEGEEFVDPEGQKRRKPKYENLPFTTQTLYNMAVNDKERLRILEQAYPGRVRTTPRGELFVEEENGVRRRGKGFQDAAGAYIASEAAPAVASMGGELAGAYMGHRAVPYLGGMVGGVLGSAVGGAAGQLFNDTVMRIAGVYDRSTEEAVGHVAGQGVLSAAGSAVGRVILPMAPGLKRWVKEAGPGALATFLGADKAALETALGLRAKDVLVPPSTWAKEAPHIHNLSEVLDPAFRTQRPFEQSAAAHMERQGTKILGDLGVDEPGSLVKPTSAVPTEEAGAAIKAIASRDVEVADRALADRVAAHEATAMADDVTFRESERGLLASAEADRVAAQRLIDDGYNQIQRDVDTAMRAANADTNSGSLWQQVAERLTALRQAIVARHRTWYQQAYRVAGNEVMDLGDLPQAAGMFLQQLPEGFANRYPQIVQRIERLADSDVTFEQLHNLRTQLRQDVDWFTLNRSVDDGVNIHFNNEINRVLHDPNAPRNLRLAGQMLDATDRSWGANMAVFNDQRLRAVVKGIESGMPADPSELFNLIVKSGRSDLTRWVAEHVGPNLWNAVRAADVQEMLNASRTLTGEIDGAKFAREVLKRQQDGMLGPVHGPNAARLVQQAQRIGIEDGSIPITAVPGDTMSDIIGRSERAATRARELARERPLDTLEQEVKRMRSEHQQAQNAARRNDPLGFLQDPSVGATEAAARVLASEDTILAAAARFGENSAEFEMLRQIYAQRILRSTMDPGRKLAGVSESVQRLMFPGITYDEMQTLAREMSFLASSKAARGGSGRSIMATERVEHPLSGFLGSVGKYLPKIPPVEAAARATLSLYYKTITELMNQPALMRFVLKGLEGSEAEKFTARNMLRAMAYGTGANRGGAMGAGIAGGIGATPLGNGREDVDPAALGAKQAPDGFWYLPDPNRPGMYLQVQ